MKKIRGFTLVELMVVVTIISILSGIAVFGLTAIRQKAQDTTRLSTLREVEIALEAYKSVNGKYPSTSEYSTKLAPTFISKMPTETAIYLYFASSDQKSYCFNVRGNVSNPASQASLVDSTHPKSWQICKGSKASEVSAN